MKTIQITQRQINSVTILDLSGKLGLGNGCIELKEKLEMLFAEGRKNFVLNMAGVSSIDASGLGELISSYSIVGSKGGKVKLLKLSDRLLELMAITKLLTVFEVFGSEASALASFPAKPEANTFTASRSGAPGAASNSVSKAAAISFSAIDQKNPDGGDCGLPAHPIFSNFSKDLWTAHKKTGGPSVYSLHRENQNERSDRA